MDIASLKNCCYENGYFDISFEDLKSVEVPQYVLQSQVYNDFARENAKLKRAANNTIVRRSPKLKHCYIKYSRRVDKFRKRWVERDEYEMEGMTLQEQKRFNLKRAAKKVYDKCIEHLNEFKDVLVKEQDAVNAILIMIPFMVEIVIPTISAKIICALLTSMIYLILKYLNDHRDDDDKDEDDNDK